MHFHCHYTEYKNFIQDILIPFLSSVNVFTYTENGQRFGEIFKTKKFHFTHALNFYNLISISFHNLHSIYELLKMPFCKKGRFWTLIFLWSRSFFPIAIEFVSISLLIFLIQVCTSICKRSFHLESCVKIILF